MEVGFLAAFLAGALTFFAACLVPVLPAYLGYLGGSSVTSAKQKELPFYQRQVFINSLFFSLGFILIFIILGLAATSVGNILSVKRALIAKIGGIILVLMGIYMLEIIKIPNLFKTWQFKPSNALRATKLGSFIFGLVFGFAWTPCIGPVLGTILIFASQAERAIYGISLLFVFGLGLALPFILIGAIFQGVQPWLIKFSKVATVIRIISAIIIIIVGVLLVTGNLALISQWMLKVGGAPALYFQGFH